MKIEVTTHAKRQVRKRLGIPRKSVEKIAQKAWELGLKQKDTSGSFRRYLHKTFCKKYTACEMRIYLSSLFLFTSTGVLMTAYHLPTRYAKQVERNK